MGVLVLAQRNAVGLQPVIDYLHTVHLPEFPSFIDEQISKDKTHNSTEFDWIRTIAEIQRSVRTDILFGFGIYADNRIDLNAPRIYPLFPL